MINNGNSPIHQRAINDLAAEIRDEIDASKWAHWNRIMQNEGRDSAGDLVNFPKDEWPRKHFDPPGYKVERLRWQGELPSDDPLPEGAPRPKPEPGPLHEPPVYAWAHRSDAGYPPSEMITIGVRGTEGLFADRIKPSEAEAREAAWEHHDVAMADFWARKLHGRR